MDMRKVKVLPLEYWMRDLFGEIEECGCCETDPVFGRDGWYLAGEKCWFETGGRAYEYEKESFLSRLDTLNHRPLRDCEYAMIDRLCKERFAPKKLRELFCAERHARELRRIRMNASAGCLRKSSS